MAKNKTVIIDDSKPSEEETKKKVKSQEPQVEEEAMATEEESTSPAPKAGRKTVERIRGKKYQEAKAKVDQDKAYSPEEAIRLAKDTSISSFGGSMQLHIVLTRGSVNKLVDLPYSGGKQKRVEIASDETVEKLKTGKIDFDVLVTSPAMMPKLVPFARLLGPRGLMPNPKNGTIADNPEEAAQKFGGNTLQVKSEAKAPLVHTVFGKVDQSEKELLENFKAIVNAVGVKSVEKVVIAASMGPGIKVAVS